MSKHPDPLLVALEKGESYTWTVPDGGYFASMRKAIQHGQTLTMSPVHDPGEVRAGDIVLVKWHTGHLFHMVGEIQGDRFLIVNSLGKVNGWVSGADILGRVTEMQDPEPRPPVAQMLDQLETAYQALAGLEHASQPDAQRLSGIAADLRWYADRLGPERWDEVPRTNKWSFEQNLWKLLRQVRNASAPAADRLNYFIDLGKQVVGLAAELHVLFEYGDPDQV